MNSIKLLLKQTFPFGAQEGKIIEAGTRRRGRDRVGFDVGMGGGDDLLRLGELEESIVEPDLQAGEVKGVVAQFDPLAAQVSGDSVTIAFERNGSCLIDLALGTVEESQTQFFRVGPSVLI